MAGSPYPLEVMKQTISAMHMTDVTICYGMTETSPVSTQTGADDSIDQRVGSVGRVHPHVEIRVVSPATGEEVQGGETGEVLRDVRPADLDLRAAEALRLGGERVGHERLRLDVQPAALGRVQRNA